MHDPVIDEFEKRIKLTKEVFLRLLQSHPFEQAVTRDIAESYTNNALLIASVFEDRMDIEWEKLFDYEKNA